MSIRRSAQLVALLGAIVYWSAVPQGQRGPSLSDDLALHHAGRHQHRVIVQASASGLVGLQLRNLGFVRHRLTSAIAMDVTDDQLAALSRDGSLLHISGDLPVSSDMIVTNQVDGASSVWAGRAGLLGLLRTPGDTGAGVAVAILDSGIAPHSALGSRVVARVNLVSDEPGVTGDPFGHGTHIAGIVSGRGLSSTQAIYASGTAPDVSLVDVRVLGRDGTGLTSDVITGIDWAIANRTRYRIRVINLSLGHPVTEPSSTDPLCQAVARAVDAGLVVVTSAGNYGRTDSGAPVLGGITSPGNSPLAITVGAFDTNGTVKTSDDTVAPYSSRGPARYEIAVKPDVVAPGTRIVSLEARQSYLSLSYPSWHMGGSASNAYMRLSGTSMSAAVVSGGAALLISAHPSMTPAQVKMVLQMGAHYITSAGLIGAGAGSVDFQQSADLAKAGLGGTLTSLTNALLGSSSPAFRDRGTLIDRVYNRSGIRLLSILNLGGLLRGAESGEFGVLNLLGLGNPLGTMSPKRLVWGQVGDWTDSYFVVWGNTIQTPSGEFVVWGNNDVTDSDFVVWGNSVVVNDR